MIIKNNLLVDNNARNRNVVNIYQANQYGVYFTNNTVVMNTKDNVNSYGAGVFLNTIGSSSAAIYNNLLWSNYINDIELAGDGKHYLSNNDIGIRVGVNPFTDVNNLSVPPEFADLTFALSLNSPLVNAGIKPPLFLPIPTPFNLAWGLGVNDFLGNNRLQDTKVDVGAFESAPETPIFEDGFE